MNNDIGYVTSFSKDLFEATGRQLLDSRQLVDPLKPLLVCREGDYDLTPWNVAEYRLEDDQFLKDWLAANRDIIPDYLGGQATECDCKERHKRHGKHKHRCHYQWMNRNASRFFRKVAAWHYTLQNWPYRFTVWLDSDCVFRRPLTAKTLLSITHNAAVCYFRGKRVAPETGILIFDRKNGSDNFVRQVCDYFVSGKFRKEERWDDGYIVGKVLEQRRGVYRDLVDRKRQTSNNVIPTTQIATFFEHLKGSHGSRLEIMH